MALSQCDITGFDNLALLDTHIGDTPDCSACISLREQKKMPFEDIDLRELGSRKNVYIRTTLFFSSLPLTSKSPNVSLAELETACKTEKRQILALKRKRKK